MTAAYYEGQEAFDSGASADDNPYVRFTPEHYEWNIGWKKAEAEHTHDLDEWDDLEPTESMKSYEPDDEE